MYKWSDELTWGKDGKPEEMQSVHVPKGMVLYVDEPSPPRLRAVIVEGELIFASVIHPDNCPTETATFDAEYIFA